MFTLADQLHLKESLGRKLKDSLAKCILFLKLRCYFTEKCQTKSNLYIARKRISTVLQTLTSCSLFIFVDIYYHSDIHIREMAAHRALLCQLASKIGEHNFCKSKEMFLFKVRWVPFISYQRLLFLLLLVIS